MIKSFILVLVILSTSYGVSIFAFPEVSSSIDNFIGFPGLSDKIRGGKSQFDTAITEIPQMNQVLSGAVDAKETIVNGVVTTKDKIDTIRSGAQKVQETVEEGKQTFDQAKQVLDDANQKLEKIQGIVTEVQNMTGSGK